MSDAAIRRGAAAAWTAVVLTAAATAAGRLWSAWAFPAILERGEAAQAPARWLAIDWLFPVWFNSPVLFTFAFGAAAWTTWKLAKSDVPPSWNARCAALAMSAAAAAGTLYFAVSMVPELFFTALGRGMCETTTFARVLSPNERYNASIIEIDCGAVSSANRQVVLTRMPFTWMKTSILRLNGEPELSLAWKGRTLTITGDKPVSAMDHPPPKHMVWGGAVAHYAGPEEKQ